MPTDRDALEMITSAKTVYNTVDTACVQHISRSVTLHSSSNRKCHFWNAVSFQITIVIF